MKRILLIDNYDSFTYNLFHYLESLGVEVEVVLNDKLSGVEPERYDALVLSPGPGLPEEAGDLMKIIEATAGRKPILGVCLGMQALALYSGGELYNQKVVKHGIQEKIHLEKSDLFDGLPSEVEVGLYHSWAVKEGSGDFKITARSASGTAMALENAKLNWYGVQFHPESVMTPEGRKILMNFISLIK